MSFKHILTFTAAIMATSGVGFLLAPEGMLAIVGIEADKASAFLLRTAGAGILALAPATWSLRSADLSTPLARAVLTGVVGYLFLSSVVDLYGFLAAIVNRVSLPSIAFRVILGSAVIVLYRVARRRQAS